MPRAATAAARNGHARRAGSAPVCAATPFGAGARGRCHGPGAAGAAAAALRPEPPRAARPPAARPHLGRADRLAAGRHRVLQRQRDAAQPDDHARQRPRDHAQAGELAAGGGGSSARLERAHPAPRCRARLRAAAASGRALSDREPARGLDPRLAPDRAPAAGGGAGPDLAGAADRRRARHSDRPDDGRHGSGSTTAPATGTAGGAPSGTTGPATTTPGASTPTTSAPTYPTPTSTTPTGGTAGGGGAP